MSAVSKNVGNSDFVTELLKRDIRQFVKMSAFSLTILSLSIQKNQKGGYFLHTSPILSMLQRF